MKKEHKYMKKKVEENIERLNKVIAFFKEKPVEAKDLEDIELNTLIMLSVCKKVGIDYYSLEYHDFIYLFEIVKDLASQKMKEGKKECGIRSYLIDTFKVPYKKLDPKYLVPLHRADEFTKANAIIFKSINKLRRPELFSTYELFHKYIDLEARKLIDYLNNNGHYGTLEQDIFTHAIMHVLMSNNQGIFVMYKSEGIVDINEAGMREALSSMCKVLWESAYGM